MPAADVATLIGRLDPSSKLMESGILARSQSFTIESSVVLL